LAGFLCGLQSANENAAQWARRLLGFRIWLLEVALRQEQADDDAGAEAADEVTEYEDHSQSSMKS
jgi:hypothetical protein